MIRDSDLNNVYHDTDDKRKITKHIQSLVQELEEMNKLAVADPDLARAHRDGHCHEAVMWYTWYTWYTHRLSEDTKNLLKDEISLPLLTSMRHELKETAQPGECVHKLCEEKVSCQSCHSNVLPKEMTV